MSLAPLSSNARAVLEHRYLWRDSKGVVRESPEELFRRVAQGVARAEARDRRSGWEARFFRAMASLRFLPNSPTLMNAGRKGGQLAACFVLPVPDSLEGIFETLKQAAMIHQSGGGTGFDFSRLRPNGTMVRSTHGVASGPVSFIRIFDTTTDIIKQGGTRRGANMAVLRVDHPDVMAFVESKRDKAAIQNFNISVGVTDAFMRAVRGGGRFSLLDPRTGNACAELDARLLFSRIVQSAWECGDPGLVFLDRINFFNPTPGEGAIESTNPCGEQPLLPFESCNLGSLNLGRYVRGRGVDWEELREDVWVAVRFLDNVIEENVFPVSSCAEITLRNRKIGLGVMGFADALLLLGLPYDSTGGQEFGERVMSFIDREAKRASASLAAERGAFPNWDGSLWHRLGYPPMRNATVSTVAPTGTISIIAGATGGIEPIFSGIFVRNVLSGERLREVHPAVERVLRERGVAQEGLDELKLREALGPAWRTAADVSVRDHVRMQAVFQRHCDSGVSKTINLPESARPSDVEEAYMLAYVLGCKGITVYRDRSRPGQVLERDAAACPSC